MLLIADAAVIVAFGESSPGDSKVPWLPGDSKAAHSFDGYIGLVVGVALVGVVSHVLMSLILLIRSRVGRSEYRPGPKKAVWRYREMSRKERRRLAALTILMGSVIAIPASLYVLLGRDSDGTGRLIATVLMTAGTLGVVTGQVMAFIQVRPSRTVMQIVEERTKHDAKIVNSILAELRAEDVQKMEEWKNDTLAELYAMIMDQVERGVISCGKCEEIGSMIRTGRNGESPVPEQRSAEAISKPCQCGGPASIRVIYPPRFQAKRTAS